MRLNILVSTKTVYSRIITRIFGLILYLFILRIYLYYSKYFLSGFLNHGNYTKLGYTPKYHQQKESEETESSNRSSNNQTVVLSYLPSRYL